MCRLLSTISGQDTPSVSPPILGTYPISLFFFSLLPDFFQCLSIIPALLVAHTSITTRGVLTHGRHVHKRNSQILTATPFKLASS